MTASSVDTAELPRVRQSPDAARIVGPVGAVPLADAFPEVLLAPEFIPLHDAGVTSAGAAPEAFGPEPEPVPGLTALPAATEPDGPLRIGAPGRAELREERRHARRQQLAYTILGLSVLVATLAATVVVLDVTR